VWLGLQGARAFARFNGIGIGFPQSSKPGRKYASQAQIEGHSLTLFWDKALGAVQFHLLTMDPGRWHTWTRIRDGSYEAGTIYVNERRGKLRLTVTYQKPVHAANVQEKLRARLQLRETVLQLTATRVADEIGLDHAVGALNRFRARREDLERRRASCGNSRAPWGFRKGWKVDQDVLSRLTRRRLQFQKDQNHAWTRRIASRLMKWGCGVVEVEIVEKAEIAGHPWNWHEFKQFLQYKVEEIGGKVVILEQDHESALDSDTLVDAEKGETV